MIKNIGNPPINADNNDLLTILNELADNSNMGIHPKNVRDAVFSAWSNVIYSISTMPYIGMVDSTILNSVYFGSKSLGNKFIMNNNLIGAYDYYIYGTTNSTTISILGGTSFYNGNIVTSPYITGNYNSLTIGNHSYGVSGLYKYGGNINILSDYGNVSLNNVKYPTRQNNTFNNDGNFLQYRYDSQNATWQNMTGSNAVLYTFGQNIINYAVQNPATNSNTAVPQTPRGVWWNSNNKCYYVTAGTRFNLLSSTFNPISSINYGVNLISTVRGNTYSDIVIHSNTVSPGTIYVYKASTLSLLGSFHPGASYSVNSFDVDWSNNNIYLPYFINGGTYSGIDVWSLGVTFSGPYTYSASLPPYNQTYIYQPNFICIDSEMNRIFSNGSVGAVQILYLGTASGTVTQYAQTPESGFNIGNYYSTANASDMSFDDNFYYIAFFATIYNSGIHVLRRYDLKYVEFIKYSVSGVNARDTATYLYADKTLNRLHITYSAPFSASIFPIVQVISTYATKLQGIEPEIYDYDNNNLKYLSSSTPIPIQIGSIQAGQTFSNVPLSSVIQQILYPYISPTIYIYLSIDAIEIGSTANVSLFYDITLSSTYSVTSINLLGRYTGSLLNPPILSTTSSSIQILPTINTQQPFTASNYIFSITDAYGSTASSLSTVYSVLPIYYGTYPTSNTYSINSILGTYSSPTNYYLTPYITIPFTMSYNLTFPITTVGSTGYVYFALPSNYPNISQIKQGSFDVTSNFNTYTMSLTSPNGYWTLRGYNVYISNITTVPNGTIYQLNF